MAGRKPRNWWLKLADALRGWRSAWTSEVNLRLHTIAAVLALTLAVALGCETWEWVTLFLTLGLVIGMELLNTAIERMFHALDEEQQQRVSGCLDVAAGAVLFSATMAVAVGLIVFTPKLWALVR
jgi:diacylglycerol kinase